MQFYTVRNNRWSSGPRVNGVEPILVIFENKKEKDQVWIKLRDNLKAKHNIVVTQDSSTRKEILQTKTERLGEPNSSVARKSSKKMAIVKPSQNKIGSPVKKISTGMMFDKCEDNTYRIN